MTDRELDILIAKEVMGLDVLGEVAVTYYPGDRYITSIDEVYDSEIDIAYLKKCSCDDGSEKDVFGHIGSECLDIVKRYSTSLAAFDVVNKLTSDDAYVRVNLSGRGDLWYADIFRLGIANKENVGFNEEPAPLPMAICLAALMVVGYTE